MGKNNFQGWNGYGPLNNKIGKKKKKSSYTSHSVFKPTIYQLFKKCYLYDW